MKKLLIILIVTGLSLGASAQHRRVMHRSYPRSHVVVGINAPVYPYYYRGYYDPFYSPYYRYGYSPRETRLELRISDIRNDYQDKIWSARHDKSLSKTERKATIQQLKHQRDQAINEAKRNYYRSR
ncbi:MAG: hypothetical protein JJE22_14215 [Bacteroidia bacterium]|nr:hypothetical protein [Bacteroidia bacterium]